MLLSAAAPARLYSLLALGRALSGVGEASFQCVAPPLIAEQNAARGVQGTWLSLYYTAIPVRRRSRSCSTLWGGWCLLLVCRRLVIPRPSGMIVIASLVGTPNATAET